MGEKTLEAVTDMETPVKMTFQVCNVKGPLGSVNEMVKAGNKVVFEQKGSYIENTTSGRKTPLLEERGQFFLQLWTPKQPTPVKPADNQAYCGQFAALQEEDEEEDDECMETHSNLLDSQGFPRLGQ